MFITVEGIEGSGKTTIIGLIHDVLLNLFPTKDILTTAEPTLSNEDGILAHKYLKKEITPSSPREHAGYFVRDRAFHVQNEILPWLSKGGIVICDRYVHSQLAYQTTDGLLLDELVSLNEQFPIPDVVVFIDIPVEAALARVHKRTPLDELEVYDYPEVLTKVDQVYRKLIRDKVLLKRCCTVNGKGSPGEIKRTLGLFFDEFAVNIARTWR